MSTTLATGRSADPLRRTLRVFGASILLLATASALTGCGGGGGDADDVQPPPAAASGPSTGLPACSPAAWGPCV